MIVRLHTDRERDCAVADLYEWLRARPDVAVEVCTCADSDAAASGHVEVRRTSLIRPAVGIVRPLIGGPAAELATSLGASPVAWEGDDEDWSAWACLRAPIEGVARAGAPDLGSRWVLVEAANVDAVPAQPTSGFQWHVVGGRERPPPHAVWWPCEGPTVAALLGEASAVVGRSSVPPRAAGPDDGQGAGGSRVVSEAGRHGPLVMDAWRVGVPVLRPSPDAPLDTWRRVEPPAVDALLANTLPPLLAFDPRAWDEIVARGAGEDHPLLTPTRLQRGRERARSDHHRLRHRLRRALATLRRDPLQRARDYRLWVVRKLFSSARPGRPSAAKRSRR